MFKNLHIKFIALVLAIIFWIFIVSLENTFYNFPSEVPIQVFNQAEGLALTANLGSVKLTLRTQDSQVLRGLSVSDFEAYIDLRNIGSGMRRMPIAVTSKNPQVSVIRTVPSDVEIELQPIKEKLISVTAEVKGSPALGFGMESVKLSKDKITVSGAESILKNIASAEAEVNLQGNEKDKKVLPVTIVVYDKNGIPLEGLKVKDSDLSAVVSVIEIESSKQVGVKPVAIGSVLNGTVKNIEAVPSVVSITGSRLAILNIQMLLTENIDLKDLPEGGERSVKLILPEGVSLAKDEPANVTVKIEIEKQLPQVPLP